MGEHCAQLTRESVVQTPPLAVFIHSTEFSLVWDFFTAGVIYHTTSTSLSLNMRNRFFQTQTSKNDCKLTTYQFTYLLSLYIFQNYKEETTDCGE